MFLCTQRAPRFPNPIPHVINGTYDVLDVPMQLQVVRVCKGAVVTGSTSSDPAGAKYAA